MNILLIQPPLNRNLVGAGVVYLLEPLALESIATGVLQHKVKILDMRIDSNLLETLNSFNPEVVGITCLTPDVYTVFNILKVVKNYRKDILTVVGGHHPTIMPDDFKKNIVDVIVIGDGQISFKELIDAYESKSSFEKIDGILFRKNGEFILNKHKDIFPELDSYAFPARNLTKEIRNRYFRASWRPVASLITSRGCPYRCNFCSVWKRESGKYRVRSAENVVEEIETIEEPYISIGDDNFLHDIKRAEKLYLLIKERKIKKTFKLIARSDVIIKRPDIIEKWREIGAEMVLLGIESFKDEDLKKFNKQNTVRNNEEAIRILHSNNITVIAQFIVSPEYTEKDFEKLGDYVEKMNLSHPLFSVLTPLPGTDLYEQRYNEFVTYNYELFDYIHSIFPTKLPRKKFYKCLADLYSRAYSYKNQHISKQSIDKLYQSIINAYKL